jgi:hypothetical protein
MWSDKSWDSTAEQPKSTVHLQLNVDLAVTGESALGGVTEYRCRLLGVPKSAAIKTTSPEWQVVRATAVAADLPEIELLHTYFMKHAISPYIDTIPENQREITRVFLGACARQFVVYGYTAVTFSRDGLPTVVNPQAYTPLTLQEYEDRFNERMPPPKRWRKEHMTEVYHAVFQNDFMAKQYAGNSTGMPFIVHGPYGNLSGGYPCAPVSTMSTTVDMLRIANRTNAAALLKNIQTEAFQVGGAAGNPALFSQTSLFAGATQQENDYWSGGAPAQDDDGPPVDGPAPDYTRRQAHLLDTYKKGLKTKTETIRELRKLADNQGRDNDTNLLRTSVHMADDATNVAFRPAVSLSDPRNAMLRAASNEILAGYGVSDVKVGKPPTAMRSAHINSQEAEEQYLSLKQFCECLERCMLVWRTAYAAFSKIVTKPPEELIKVALPIDMAMLIQSRLSRRGLVALLSSHIPQLTEDMILPDEEPAAKNPSHQRLSVMPAS